MEALEMRWLPGPFLTLALGLPTVAAAQSPPGPADAIILGGGKAAPDADAVLAMWPRPWGADIVRPAPGFPKVVESATVAGLNPGFHIVVLGFCATSAATAPVEAVRWVFPGAYTRAVTGVAPACPEVVGNPTPRSEQTVERDGLSLDAMLFEVSPTKDALVVQLRRKDVALEGHARAFVSERTENPSSLPVAEECARPELAAAAGGLVVEWECTSEWPDCCQGGPEGCPEVTRNSVEYRIADGHLQRAEHDTVTAYQSTCGE